jgi:ectoine hydroxylase-related dioxygenase (phytanoyl-CoA dioxygenase family)
MGLPVIACKPDAATRALARPALPLSAARPGDYSPHAMATVLDDRALDASTATLEEDGICILRDVIDVALVERWADAFDALVRERRARPGGLAPRGPGRFYVTLPWCAPFSDPAVWANPAILGVLDRALAQEHVMVQLAADTPVRGSARQEIHRDYRPLFTDDVVTPLYALAVNFPLCDVGDDNGPLEMARGTHRMPRDRALAAIAAGQVAMERFPMRRGDVAIRTPLALHRGTPNVTDRPRPMIVLGWVMHWLHTPKVDLRIARRDWETLPESQRRLLRCEVVERLPDAPVETYVEFEY